jgi:hypothetical protein
MISEIPNPKHTNKKINRGRASMLQDNDSPNNRSTGMRITT